MAVQGFDHWVHHRDKKTGKITRTNLYSMECHREIKFYRRDGKCWDAAGKEIPDPKLVGQPGGSYTRSVTAVAAQMPYEQLPAAVQKAPSKS
jgi:hypothetical protein